MSRIINKLAEASGGWEKFLYQTLKEVCGALGDTEAFQFDAVSEAKEILEAYEELAGGHPDKARKRPTVVNDQSIEEVSTPVRVIPVIKTMKVESVENVEWKLEDIILTPPPRRAPKSKRLKAKISIGADVGGSQGDLPLPARQRIVDRQDILITNRSGQQLGVSNKQEGFQGQISGKHVSGHISVSGAYRLAFKDNTLGSAFIHFNVESIPSKLTSKQFEEAIATVNKLSVEDLRERLEHFGMVYTPCKCGKDDCFGWKIVDQAVLDEAEAKRKARLAAARNESSIGR